MNVLVVYELVPETTRMFLFENLNSQSEYVKNLKLCHGFFTNQVFSKKEKANEKAVGWLTKLMERVETDEGVAGITEIEIVKGLPVELGGIDLLIHTGFIL